MKKIALSAACFLHALLLFGQGWERVYPKLSVDEANDFVRQLPDGSYFGVRTLRTNGPDFDYSLALFRVDPDGQLTDTVRLVTEPDADEIALGFLPLAGNSSIITGYSRPDSVPQKPKGMIMKVTAAGNTLWKTTLTNGDLGRILWSVIQMPDGRFAVSQTEYLNAGIASSIAFFDSLGQYLEQFPVLPQLPNTWIGAIALSGDGFLYAFCSSSTKTYLIKLEPDGDQAWIQDVTAYSNFQAGSGSSRRLVVTPDNGVAFLDHLNPKTPQDSFLMHVVKYDPDGQYAWTYPLYATIESGNPLYGYSFTRQDSSLVAIISANHVSATLETINERVLARIDALSGTETFRLHKAQPLNRYEPWDIATTSDGGYIVSGGVTLPDDPPLISRPYLWKLDAMGNIFSNVITGLVVTDDNLDCAADSTELPLKRFFVQAQKTGHSPILTQTDSLGQYRFELDTGAYTVRILAPNAYWGPCPDSVQHVFNGFYQDTTIHLPLQPEVSCALPEVDISIPFLRRCFENTYHAQVCNRGTVPLDSGRLQLVLDPYMIFVSAQPQPDSVAGDTLWFMFADTLAVSDCFTFSFTILLDCDSTVTGQTHCVEARVLPDTFCLSPPGWSGASIEVKAECLNNTWVRIVAANKGNAPTAQPVDFIIVEDDVILFQGSQHLNPGQEWEKLYAAGGSYWLGEASQEPYHPLGNMPRAFVEGCAGLNSPGYPLLYAQDDSSPFLDIDCRQSVASYDPNDKTGIPIGTGAEHFIEQNEAIEYTIRFQNTGTDTAFTVALRDTLSPWLDWASLRIGAASHPYSAEITGPGVLKFLFQHINLPPDSVNEPASQGYVHFRIQQKRDNPLGTQILNSAAIFFDFNAPVITNQTLHTVAKDFLTVSTAQAPGTATPVVRTAPNPVQDIARFTLNQAPGQVFTFELYGPQGQLLQRQEVSGPKFEFLRGNLPAGMYFFRLTGEDAWQTGGRLVLAPR